MAWANAEGEASMAASDNPSASERGVQAAAMIFFFMVKPLNKTVIRKYTGSKSGVIGLRACRWRILDLCCSAKKTLSRKCNTCLIVVIFLS